MRVRLARGGTRESGPPSPPPVGRGWLRAAPFGACPPIKNPASRERHTVVGGRARLLSSGRDAAVAGRLRRCRGFGCILAYTLRRPVCLCSRTPRLVAPLFEATGPR